MLGSVFDNLNRYTSLVKNGKGFNETRTRKCSYGSYQLELDLQNKKQFKQNPEY